MDSKRFNELAGQFNSKRILVIGDLMLDTYMWGATNRISPEAPVPVVSIENVTHSPGGAANVSWNLAALSAQVSVAGIVGQDQNGSQLVDILNQMNVDCGTVIVATDRRTSVKTRIIAQGQQLVRTDDESTEPIPEKSMKDLLKNIGFVLAEMDGIILADYNKGLLTDTLIHAVIANAESSGTPVYVDPKKDNFFEFQNIRLFKPNAQEFKQSVDHNISAETVSFLRKKINADHVLVTLGAEGMWLITDLISEQIPTKARAAHDVSGAGDTVISVYTLADLSGATAVEAATLSNLAAGRVCEEVGVVAIDLAMINEIFDRHHS